MTKNFPVKVLRYFAELNKQKNKPLFLAFRDLGKSAKELKKAIKDSFKF